VYASSQESYCDEEIKYDLRLILRSVRKSNIGDYCVDVFQEIRTSKDHEKAIMELANNAAPLKYYSFLSRNDEVRYIYDELKKGYVGYEAQVPTPLTEKLQYNPGQYNVIRMMTSIFTHADGAHLLGNLLGFYIFAAAIEIITGPILFVTLIIIMSVSTSLAYSFSVSGSEGLPAIGLSGVVMGMMTMLVVLMPRVNVLFFFWYFLWIRIIRIPVWFVAVWYVGWNMYSLHLQQTGEIFSNINFVAHVSGAFTGLLAGLLYRLCKPQYIRDLVSNIDY
jgi:membrane associated rhomboid family serine protease